MVIIQSKMKKTLLILIITIMLMSVTIPVLAATYTGSINVGDKLKFTGKSWTIYKTESAAKNLDKSQTNGALSKNQEVTVSAKNGNVLKIGTNKYIYYGSSAANNFTKVKQEETQKPSTGGSSGSGGTASGIGDAIGGLVSGIGTVVGGIVESGALQNILKTVMDILARVFSNIMSSLGNISLPSFDIPSIELPENDETEMDKPNLTLNASSIDLTVKGTFELKATVYGNQQEGDDPNKKIVQGDLIFTSSNNNVATIAKDGTITAISKGDATITATYYYKDVAGGELKNEKATCKVKVTAKSSTAGTTGNTSGWKDFHFTNYTPYDDAPGTNYGTSKLGVVLKNVNGKLYIVHPDVYINSNGWFVYRYNGQDYVILAKLKSTSNSYGGLEDYEIVKFKFNNTEYKGVILDVGSGGVFKNPGIDIFLTKNASKKIGSIDGKAIDTNTYITVKTNYNASKYSEPLREVK